MSFESLKSSKIIAHRGASAYAPENTLIAMEMAAQMGAAWCEFDVMLAGSGEAIIIHDETVDRTTDGSGDVATFSLAQLKALDAGKWFDPKFTGERVPSFVELLALLRKLKLNINVEIKPSQGFDVQTAEKTVELLNQHWNIKKSPPLLSSQSLDALRTVRECEPHWHLGCVIHDWAEHWYTWVKELNCTAVSVNHHILEPNLVAGLKNIVPLVLAYTVNDVKRADELFNMGVDAIFTDVLMDLS